MRFSFLILLALLLAPFTDARGEDLGAVPDPVREDMMQGHWDKALGKLELLGTQRPDDRDLWLLLAGVAHERAGRAEEALGVLRQLEEEHPESPWISKARFRKAEIHRTQGRYEKAEAIYEAAVFHLRSPERQGELAGVYLEYADDASTPPSVPTPGHRLDYERAFSLYAKVLELEAPRDLRDHALFRMAICQEKIGSHDIARQRYESYLEEFDPSRQRPLPAGFEAGKKVWIARLRLGQTELMVGRAAQARRTLEDLAADLSEALESGRVPAELRELAGEARYDMARTYGGEGDGAQLAIAAYGRFLDNFARHQRSTLAAFAIAELERGLGHLEKAATAYRSVSDRAAPETEDVGVLAEHARLQARARYLGGVVLQLDLHFPEAIAQFESYTRRHPNGADWSKAQQGIVEARYKTGADHRSHERFDEAREAWLAFLAFHPLDSRAAQIAFDLGQLRVEESAVLRADNPKVNVDALLRLAVDRWESVTQKYPGSKQASRALFQTGRLLETELGDLVGAIESYRSCVFGSHAGKARERLAIMTEPSLEIFTERSWRTDEPATVKCLLRNVEEVEVEHYALDLEAYFRKHLTHRRVEELDLDLIAPDESMEVAVEDYRDHAPLKLDVDLGLEGPGVWAVVVTAGELRATTLVIRSDVDVIVKSSRREVFVFAQDLLAGGPAANVSVLVALPGSGETPILEELTTDDDGVARLELDGLADSDAVRVLSVREGHYASDGLLLSGLSVAQGLTERGHVSTDRSAYRPGDSVRWRAILRTVEDGAYHFEPGAQVDVSIVDSQGRPFFSETLVLSDFGTVHGDVTLSDQAPVGSYQLQLSGPGLPTCTGLFQVQQYQLQKVELTLEPGREVVYRGEEVLVTARAAYYYGEPVVDSPLSYQLPDGRVLETRTDQDGLVEIRFGTRDFPHEGSLYVGATLSEEGVSASTGVWMATRGFQAEVSTPLDVVLAGDSFPVTVRATDPGGKAVAREMLVEVLRRESATGGQWREVVVETRSVTTSEDDGQAHLVFAVEGGGAHHLRATGTDRFGNPITAEEPLLVSGDDDSVQLRLLAGSSRTKVGEELSFELVNRAGPGLALVTFEGEKILGYRLIELEEGRNQLSLDVGHEHFPNVVVAAAMMRGNELFEAASEFDVARDLRVEILPREDVLAPGAETAVELVVTDQLGRPVSAELTLAVVDASLFDLYPDITPGLGSFFEAGARRSAGLRTTSSCRFAYQGVTATIDQAILDELELQEAEVAWESATASLKKSLGELKAGPPASMESLGMRNALGGGGGGRGHGPAAPGPAGPQTVTGSDDWFDSQRFRSGGEKFGGRSGKGLARDRGIELGSPDFDSHTAFWSPTVTTDEDGRADLAFQMPETSTRWRLTSLGVTRATLTGEAQAELITRSGFFVELRAPQALTEGDQPRLAARLHNLTGETGAARVVLSTGEGAERRTSTVDLELGESSVVEHRFEALDALSAGSLSVSVSVSGEVGGEAVGASATDQLQIYPRGLEVTASRSAELEDTQTFLLELPGGASYDDRQLELHVGPSVSRMLIDEALGRITGQRPLLGGVDHARVASDLLGCCALLDALRSSGQGSNPEFEDIRRHARGLLASLVAAQNGDGGWTWVGRGQSQAETTANVALGLAAAREAGLAPPEATLGGAVDLLTRIQRELPQGALERKAAVVHALAALGRDDFAAANALHRERNRLSPAARAHTALALAAMERSPMAAEVAALLEGSIEANLRCSTGGNLAWHRDPLAMSALAALALEATLPSSSKLDALERGLLASRPWSGSRGRGLAIAAVASKEAGSDRRNDRARVTVNVEGMQPLVISLAGDTPGRSLSLSLPGEGRRAKVSFTLEGRGHPFVSARLVGYTENPGELITDVPFGLKSIEYRAEPARYRGKELPAGFGALRDRKGAWKNLITGLPTGRTTRVQVELWRTKESVEGGADFLVLEIPLPAGARLLSDSIKGGLGQHQIRDGKLIVPVGSQLNGAAVTFTLLGVDPGTYRVRGAVLRSAYEPGRMAVLGGRNFSVLGRGTASPDEYRPTPNELLAHGGLLYEDGDLSGAHGVLGALYEEHQANLRTPSLRTLARIMLTTSLAQGDPSSAVRFFEVLREKDPSYTVPFDQIMAVGEAYRDLEEYERAYLIFRAIALETFGKDLEVAGTLQDAGENAGALDVLDELTLAYPDLPTVVEARLALADQILALAPTAHRDPSLVRAGYDRAALTSRGILHFKRFLSLNPGAALAPDAGLGLVSAYLGMDDPETAAELAGQMAELFTEPRYSDAFLYTRAVAQWYLGLEDEARSLLQRIADAIYEDESGKEFPSENRNLALYILAQIAHAQQDVETAEEYYEQIDHLFTDAREALEGFRRRTLSLEEVTTARPGEEISLELRYKNLKQAELLVYSVDLMTLYLREKDLSQVTAVNLAGIAPRLTRTVTLGKGSDLREQDATARLSLSEPGAYLVIARSGALHASGLVLVTDLELEVAEDPTSGRVRVQAIDRGRGTYQRDVDVRVVGAASGSFVKGDTDPRGLFLADGIVGAATVVARLGDHYAFHRGAASPEQLIPIEQLQTGNSLDKRAYFSNVLQLNEQQVEARQENLQQEILQNRKGVQVDKIR